MRFAHALYLCVSRQKNKKKIERLFVYAAFMLFLLHIVLIFSARNTDFLPRLLSQLNPNYLSALYTPFSVILVYEVYVMILALPMSFTDSIRKQFEIISLIIIRRVFKDISDFNTFEEVLSNGKEFLDIIFDLGGGIVLFALVAVFHHASKNRTRRVKSAKLKDFIRFKEMVSLALAVLLCFLAVSSLVEWSREVYMAGYGGVSYSLNIHTIFFDDLFTVMIFTDVLIFIASFLYANRYEILFRNAGYVASTVLIRISLTVEYKYGILIAVGAVLTGILVQLICRYYDWLDTEKKSELYPG